MVVFVLILALLIALVTLVFAVANSASVTVNLLFAQIPTQLSLAILSPFVAGVLVGLLVMLPGRIRVGLTVASHKRKIDTLEKSQAAASAPAVPDDQSKA